MYKSDEEKFLTCNSSCGITGDIDVEGFSLSKLAGEKNPCKAGLLDVLLFVFQAVMYDRATHLHARIDMIGVPGGDRHHQRECCRQHPRLIQRAVYDEQQTTFA